MNTPFIYIPNEIIMYILSYVSKWQHYVVLRRVCCLWYDLSKVVYDKSSLLEILEDLWYSQEQYYKYKLIRQSSVTGKALLYMLKQTSESDEGILKFMKCLWQDTVYPGTNVVTACIIGHKYQTIEWLFYRHHQIFHRFIIREYIDLAIKHTNTYFLELISRDMMGFSHYMLEELNIYEIAIKYNNIDIVGWLSHKYIKPNIQNIIKLVEDDRLDMLDKLIFFLFYDVSIIRTIYRIAALNGHLNIIIWVRNHTNVWLKRICEHAARKGHLEILLYVANNNLKWSKSRCSRVSKFSHVIEWVRNLD
jgi:hypothetical protein